MGGKTVICDYVGPVDESLHASHPSSAINRTGFQSLREGQTQIHGSISKRPGFIPFLVWVLPRRLRSMGRGFIWATFSTGCGDTPFGHGRLPGRWGRFREV